MVKANLIVSYDPSHIGSAKEEVENVLKEVKHSFKHLKQDVDGLFNLGVKDARKTVKSLSQLCKKKPEFFEKTFHWVPIDKWCKSTVVDMQKIVKKIEKDIKKTEKWKMELNKRHYKKGGDTVELIIKLTDVVDKPNVDLKKPQKIIKVEIIGNKAGLSLLKADELLNTLKTK